MFLSQGMGGIVWFGPFLASPCYRQKCWKLPLLLDAPSNRASNHKDHDRPEERVQHEFTPLLRAACEYSLEFLRVAAHTICARVEENRSTEAW